MANNQEMSVETSPMVAEEEGKLLISMAFPVMVSMLAQALYNIVDSAYIGFYSENALSAVSMAFPFQTLFSALNVGIGVGMSQHISLSRGKGNTQTAKETAAQGVLLSVICAAIFLIWGLLFSGRFFALSKVYGEIAAMGKTYLMIVTVFSLGIFCESAYERILMALGHTRLSMVSQILGAVLNIILDPVLIFGIGPVPAMGVAGAAIATVFSQHAAAFAAWYFHRKYTRELDFRIADMRPSGKIIAGIVHIGASATLKQGAGSVVLVMVNTLLYDFSSTAVAVYGAFNKLYVFFLTPSWAIQNVFVILVAYNFGKGNRKRYTKFFRLTLIYSVVITIAGSAIVCLFPDLFLSVFGAGDSMRELGRTAFPILACFLPFQAVASVISSMLQGLGEGRLALIAGLIERFVLPIGFVYLIAGNGNLNLVWWAFTFAEVIGDAVSAMFLVRTYRSLQSL